VVGDATAARIPELDEIFNYNKEVTNWKDTRFILGPHWELN
jgi:hypothetical protein